MCINLITYYVGNWYLAPGTVCNDPIDNQSWYNIHMFANYYYRSLYMTRFDSFVSSKLTCNGSSRSTINDRVAFVFFGILANRLRLGWLAPQATDWKKLGIQVAHTDDEKREANWEFYYENVTTPLANIFHRWTSSIIHCFLFQFVENCWLESVSEHEIQNVQQVFEVLLAIIIWKNY